MGYCQKTNTSTELMNIEHKLKQSLQTLVTIYCNRQNKPVVANNIWQIISYKKESFIERVKQLDAYVAEHDFLDDISELFFDHLLVLHLSDESHDEDYFESAEWNEIENKTLDRGSELLNLLIYITEAQENEIEISLEDFLNEHLLVDDDDYKDEVEIYEPFITNPEIVDAEVEEIVLFKNSLKKDNGINAFLVPFSLFFKHVNFQKPDYSGKITDFELAVFESLMAFANA